MNDTRDLGLLYTGGEDLQIEKDNTQMKERFSDFVSKRKHETSYLKDISSLLEAVEEYDALMSDYGSGSKESIYFRMKTVLDSGDVSAKARLQKAQEMSTKLHVQVSFFTLELAKLPLEIQQHILQDKTLSVYRHRFEKLFSSAAFDLSEEAEKVVTMLHKPAKENRFQMVDELFSAEKNIMKTKGSKEYSFEEILSFCGDTDAEIRAEASKNVDEFCKKHVHIAEKELNSILEYRKIVDDLRGYERPDQSRHLGDDVRSEVVDALVSVVSENASVPHRYYSLLASLYGKDALQYQERSLTWNTAGEKQPEYTFTLSKEIVKRVVDSLDPRFGEILEKMLEEGRIDVFPREGKQGGAFNYGAGKNGINVIKLNHTGTLSDVATFAHELGHALHTQFSKENQNGLQCGYGMFAAEVASTYIEDFVFEELLKECDDATRLSLMIGKVGGYIATIWRQVACYSFEKDLHHTWRETGYLDKEQIGQMFVTHMKSYMGNAIVFEEGSEHWWTYWSHLRYYFYVYSYASGSLISQALQAKTKEDPAFVQDYIQHFLSAGSSLSPEEAFSNMGLNIADVSFRESGIQKIERMMDEIEELAKKLGVVEG